MKQPGYITLYLGDVPIMRLSMEQVAALPPNVRRAVCRAAGIEPPLPLSKCFEEHKFASLDLALQATEEHPRLQLTRAYELYKHRN